MAQSKLFSYETLVHAIAGATGSVIAMATFYPFDTVRSRLQIDSDSKAESTLRELKKIVRKEGYQSLYKGIMPVLESLCLSNFIYFYTFHGLKSIWHTSNVSNDFLIGVIAGVTNVLLTNPFWVVNTRLKTPLQPFDNLFGGIFYILREESVQSLWAGTLPSLLLVSNPAIQFMVYENLKRSFTKDIKSNDVPTYVYFLLGAIAKSVATVITYPLQLVQTKLRHDSNNNSNLIIVLTTILRRNGFFGLFKGLEAKMYHTVLAAALMFAAYEKIFKFIVFLLKVPTKHV